MSSSHLRSSSLNGLLSLRSHQGYNRKVSIIHWDLRKRSCILERGGFLRIPYQLSSYYILIIYKSKMYPSYSPCHLILKAQVSSKGLCWLLHWIFLSVKTLFPRMLLTWVTEVPKAFISCELALLYNLTFCLLLPKEMECQRKIAFVQSG